MGQKLIQLSRPARRGPISSFGSRKWRGCRWQSDHRNVTVERLLALAVLVLTCWFTPLQTLQFLINPSAPRTYASDFKVCVCSSVHKNTLQPSHFLPLYQAVDYPQHTQRLWCEHDEQDLHLGGAFAGQTGLCWQTQKAKTSLDAGNRESTHPTRAPHKIHIDIRGRLCYRQQPP